jgi:hypothetical protein
MKKILIKDNATIASRSILIAEKLIVEINQKIIPAFNDLNIGELNTELLHELLSDRFQSIDRLISIQAENDTGHIKTPSIKNEMLRVIDKVKNDFTKTCKSVINYDTVHLIKYIEVKAGIAKSIKGANEAIIEDAKYYITDPKEIEIYNEIKTIAEAYNRILLKVGERSKTSIRINGISDYLDFHPTTYEAEPSENINYSSMILL